MAGESGGGEGSALGLNEAPGRVINKTISSYNAELSKGVAILAYHKKFSVHVVGYPCRVFWEY